MVLDGLEQLALAAIVQEEQPLANSPQRSSTEFVWTSITLADPIRESTHVMDGKVGEGTEGLVVQAREILRGSGSEDISMA